MPAENLKQATFNRKLGLLLTYAAIQEINVIVSSFIRTPEQQAENYKVGRRGIAGEATITDCDGYNRISRHQTKVAIDLNVIDGQGNVITDDKPYQVMGLFWESLGGQWGGRFTKPPEPWHFDLV